MTATMMPLLEKTEFRDEAAPRMKSDLISFHYLPIRADNEPKRRGCNAMPTRVGGCTELRTMLTWLWDGLD